MILLIAIVAATGAAANPLNLDVLNSSVPCPFIDIYAVLPPAAKKAVREFRGQRFIERRVRCLEDNRAVRNATEVGTSRYQYRSANKQCFSPKGMWGHPLGPLVGACWYRSVARLLNLRRPHVVLDWGAGCGHSIDLLAQERSVRAVAVDLIESNVAYGRAHLTSLYTFCRADGFHLPFSDGSFDVVVSFGSFHHVKGKQRQCAVLREQVLRVLRPGGCAFFGWHGANDERPPYSPRTYWTGEKGCFSADPNIVSATWVERDLFPAARFPNSNGFFEGPGKIDTYSIFFCKSGPSSVGIST